MATQLRKPEDLVWKYTGDLSKWNFTLFVSEWNDEITSSLANACMDTLKKQGIKDDQIKFHWVPGSFELSTAALWAAKKNASPYHAVICLGCVIQGETRHFDFICDAVANGITKVSADTLVPVIFGVLTTNTLKQAQERAGGEYGNKGEEAAITALKMLHLRSCIS